MAQADLDGGSLPGIDDANVLEDRSDVVGNMRLVAVLEEAVQRAGFADRNVPSTDIDPILPGKEFSRRLCGRSWRHGATGTAHELRPSTFRCAWTCG